MAEPQKKKKAPGRPPADIDKDLFEKLCYLQCTESEICGCLGVTDKTLVAWIRRTYGKKYNFSEIFQIKSAGGKISLRRAQFKLAERDGRVAIWLGQQYLGQRDPHKVAADQKAQEETPNDGFLEALKGVAEEVWPQNDPEPEK